MIRYLHSSPHWPVNGGVAAVLLGLAMPVAGQQGDDGPLEEIVVTAQKRETSLQTTAITMSAFTVEMMDVLQVTDIGDLERYIPNVRSGQDEGDAFLNYRIRGIGSNSASRVFLDLGVGIYVDGVFIPRAQGAGLDLLDTERIEVLRGPQGTLFGRNTIGGAVHYITRKPSEEFEAKVKGGIGNFGSQSLKTMVNVPVSDSLLLRLSAASDDRNQGYFRDVLSGEEYADKSSFAARAAARWLTSDAVTVDLTLQFSELDTSSYPSILTGIDPSCVLCGLADMGLPNNNVTGSSLNLRAALNALLNPLGTPPDPFMGVDLPAGQALPVNGFPGGFAPTDDPTPFLWTPGEDPFTTSALGGGSNFFNNETIASSLVVEWRASSSIAVKSITGIRSYEELTANDLDGSPAFIVGGTANTSYDALSQELQLTGQHRDARVHWAAGLYFFSENVDRLGSDLSGFPFLFDPAFPAFVGPRGEVIEDLENESVGVYGQISLALTDQLSLTAGGRWSEDNREFTKVVCLPDCINDLPDPFFVSPLQSNSWSEFTPMVSLDFSISDDVFVYALASEGYKSGALNGEGNSANVLIPIDPETVVNYELGLKSRFVNDRVQLNVAAFSMDYEDIQARIFGTSVDGALQIRLTNAAKASVDGAEVELTAFVTDRLLLRATVGLLDATYDDFIDPSPEGDIDRSGESFPHSPEYTYSILTTYEFSETEYGSFSASLDYSYVDDHFLRVENLSSDFEEGYGTLNGRLRWESADRHWIGQLWARNMTDEIYRTAGRDVSDRIGWASSTFGPPRTFGVEVTYNY